MQFEKHFLRILMLAQKSINASNTGNVRINVTLRRVRANTVVIEKQ